LNYFDFRQFVNSFSRISSRAENGLGLHLYFSEKGIAVDVSSAQYFQLIAGKRTFMVSFETANLAIEFANAQALKTFEASAVLLGLD
jgi:hypothetical protein